MMKRLLALLLVLTAAEVFGASPLEGDWQMTGDGARLRFRPAQGTSDSYDILWIDGPDLSIAPGTVIGSATAAPTAGVYDCTVDTDPRGKGKKKRLARFVIRIDSDRADSFTVTPYEQGMKISVAGLLPYWWRRSIKNVDTRPSGLDGSRRVGAPPQFIEL